MADFYDPNPDIQRPDFLAAAVRGAMAPGALAEQQQGLQIGAQGVQSGQLNLDMLRQMMAFRTQALTGGMGMPSGAQPTQTGEAPGGPSGGIQNGPQGSVSSQPNDPLASLLDPRRIAGYAAYGSLSNMLQGKDPNQPIADALKLQMDASTDQINRTRLALAPKQAEIENVISSPNPERLIMNNPDYMQGWRLYAPQLGLDPSDPKSMTSDNVRAAATLGYNHLVSQYGGEPKPMPNPVKNVPLGQGEVGQIDPITGKKVGDLTERQPPTFTMVDKWDPATNTTTKVPVQSGGAGMSGVGPTGQVVGPKAQLTQNYPGTAASLGFNSGMKAPTDPELKAAMFGSEMRSGLQTMQQLESGGFSLSAAQRTALVNAATSEEPGAIKQFFSQEYLSKMSPQAQTYIAALMPMLQAAGHDQSGARLSTAQIRQNLESTIPPADATNNPQLMAQINKNRQGFYVGLLGQAGSATQLPQYKNTLGADLKSEQGIGTPHEGLPSNAAIQAEIARRKAAK